MTDADLNQLVLTLRFAGLTPGQQSALNKILTAFKDQRAAAQPFGVLADRYIEYRRQHADLSRKAVLDFTAWLDKYGEDPDVLFAQCKAVAEGQLDEQNAHHQTAS